MLRTTTVNSRLPRELNLPISFDMVAETIVENCTLSVAIPNTLTLRSVLDPKGLVAPIPISPPAQVANLLLTSALKLLLMV
jgi:hypothetical protein